MSGSEIQGTCPAWAIRVLTPHGSWWVSEYGVTTWIHRRLFVARFYAHLTMLDNEKRGRKCRLVKITRRATLSSPVADGGSNAD